MVLERRRNPRIGIEFAGRLDRGNLHPLEVSCRDISLGGFCLVSREAIASGSRYHLELLTNPEKLGRMKVEAVWQREYYERDGKGEFKKYLVGARLLRTARYKQNDVEIFINSLTFGGMNGPGKAIQREESATRWRLPDSRFVYNKRVFLKHTNLEGNTYYDNYVAWHGEAREALLLSHPMVREFLKSDKFVKMITHSLYQRYIRDTFFGDVVRIEVTSKEIKQCSFVLVFRFYREQTDELVGEGWQKICFAGFKTGKICRIPEIILDLIEPISEVS